MTPTAAQSARLAMRKGEWTGPTKHTLAGYAKCNLVIVPEADAGEMLGYCLANPKACPLVEVMRPGQWEPGFCAAGADLRTDLSRYAVYADGRRMADMTDICSLWRPDFVSFLIGSGTTWDPVLEQAGIACSSTWLFETTLPTRAFGRIHGPMVVTMRLLMPEQVEEAARITSGFELFHGGPVHVGDHRRLGIDLQKPLVGEPVTSIPATRIPVFWACGVTPQAAALNSKLPLVITHAPTHAFVTDITIERAARLTFSDAQGLK
jgi:uncharacterized protein YcsI (UPF0317 family)